MDTGVREQHVVVTSGWDQALVRAAIALIALLAVAAVALRDLEAAALTVGGLVALALLRFRTGLLGRLALALLGTNVAFWMGTGAVSNLTHGEGFWETALPSALTIASVATLVAAVGAMVTRRTGSVAQTGPRIVQAAAVAVALAALVLAAIGVGDQTQALAGDIELVTEDVKFSEDDVTAEAGTVGVVVANRDLFWHTFTIKELDVNVNVPVGGERRVAFEASPGTYEFICAIPGHTQAGMKGTLTVR
jgi:plastocyanin